MQHAKGFENRKARALKAIGPNVATFDMMKKAGLNMEIFSGGGTGIRKDRVEVVWEITGRGKSQ